MPRSWWGKSLTVIYVLGYFVFVIAAGVTTWGTFDDFGSWQWYMTWQLGYGVIWPILLVVQIIT